VAPSSGTDLSQPVAYRTLATTRPFDGATLFAFLRRFAVPGVEAHTEVDGVCTLVRSMRLAHGPGLVRVRWDGSVLGFAFAGDPADEEDAVRRTRRLVDADAPVAEIGARLGADEHLAPDVASSPGLRLPGATDVAEAAVQALVSQQISMAAAARCSAKLAEAYGERLDVPDASGVAWLFPTTDALAAADPETLPMPRARGRALVGLAAALASGSLVLDPERGWAELRRSLIALPGIGPWTADVVGLRALGERDVLLGTDLAVRRQLEARGITATEAWSPFRSYATVHLWRPYV